MPTQVGSEAIHELQESYLFIQILPSRIDAIDQRFLLFPTSTFNALFFSDRLRYSVKPLVINQLDAIVFSRKTVWINFVLMGIRPGRQI